MLIILIIKILKLQLENRNIDPIKTEKNNI